MTAFSFAGGRSFHPAADRLGWALRAMSGGRGRHHHHRGPGFGPGMPPFDVLIRRGFGPGGPGGPGGPWSRRKARRGDVRMAALLLLAEEPRNGYGIMQELEERSDGAWRPSPGSVYPALQQLEDEGLIRSEEQDGRRLYHLTDAGRAYVAERSDEEPAPWEAMAHGGMSEGSAEAMGLARDVGMAFSQVLNAGSEAQIAEAGKVLAETRRSLYRILADGEPPAGTEPEPGKE